MYSLRKFTKKKCDNIEHKMPAKILTAMIKYRQAAQEAKLLFSMIISGDLSNCIKQETDKNQLQVREKCQNSLC